ncbi:MAG: 3-isopropylmalate dehydratase [Hyphomicrobiales bacterium]|nr:3-isopropylmalate dehydratase [Hyphomicrobiales bacterium]MCP4997577.1 3-isopropylmalate dehydratase [Hyphomicrobiales bacterium]
MSGRIFLFGDNIDTDQMAPGKYMRGGLEMLAAHCLEGVRADFASTVRTGDIVVAGRNFGVGSSREQAAEALIHLGIAAVIAQSFAGIFYRNATNLGLPVLVCQDISALKDGAHVTLVLDAGQLTLSETGVTVPLDPLPDNLKILLADGGLIPHLKKRFAREKNK